MPTITTTVAKTITIKPTIKRKLLTELRTYAQLKGEIKVLEQALEGHKTAIETCRQDIGEKTFELEGFKIAYVEPVRTSLSKEKLLASGVTIGQIEDATETKPTKPYVKISLPGEKERDY